MAISLRAERENPQDGNNGRRPKAKDAPSNSPFRYVYDPHSWMFMDATGEWLPELREFKLSPGVGGVDEHRNPRRAIANVIAKGWTWIKADDAALGPYKDYCRSIRNEKGGKHWFPMFAGARLVGTRTHWMNGFEADVADRAREKDGGIEEAVGHYPAFLRYLVENDIVSAMDDAVLEDEIDKAESLLAECVGRLGSNPNNGALKERVSRLRDRAEAMRSGKSVPDVIAARAAAEAPPKRKPGRPAKASA
jgi:hypothetical protein